MAFLENILHQHHLGSRCLRRTTGTNKAFNVRQRRRTVTSLVAKDLEHSIQCAAAAAPTKERS
jgi:hypothetical protein